MIDKTYEQALSQRLIAGIRSRMLAAYLSSRNLRRRARLAAANEPATRLYLMGRADTYLDLARSLSYLLHPERMP